MIPFCPSLDDTVEFLSDRLTEKGPSSGKVILVDETYCVVRHSDTPGEVFFFDDVEVVKQSPRHDGGAYWGLA